MADKQSICPIIQGVEYDAADEGPCHEGCETCAIYACPWAYEGHFDDLGCCVCDDKAVYNDTNYFSQSARLAIALLHAHAK